MEQRNPETRYRFVSALIDEWRERRLSPQHRLLLRFGAALVLIIALATSLSAWLSYRHTAERMRAAVGIGAESVLSNTANIAAAMLRDYDLAMLQQIKEAVGQDPQILFFELRRPDGKVFFEHGAPQPEMMEYSRSVETYGQQAAVLTLGYSPALLQGHLRDTLLHVALTLAVEALLILGLVLLLFRAEVMSSMQHEIAQRRRAESDRNFIQFVLDTIERKILLVNGAGRILLTNHKAQCVGRGRQVPADLADVALLPEGQSPPLGALVQETAASPEGSSLLHHYRLENDDATLYEITATRAGNYLDSAEPLVLLAVADISARRETFRKLRLFATLFENTSEAIMVTDQYGRIIELNRAFSRLTGYLEEDILGRQPPLFREDQKDSDVFTRMLEALLDNDAWNGTVWGRTKNDERVPFLTAVNTIRGEDGEVTNVVAILRDMTEIRSNEERLERLAYYDPLTGLANRLMFRRTLENEILRGTRQHLPCALMLIDLDRFKAVNDTLGHDAGDRLLVEIGRRMRACLRQEDLVGRLGGDEFVAVLINPGNPASIEVLAKRILAAVGAPVDVGRDAIAHVGASIGIALFPADGVTVEDLTKEADLAMYASKKAGRNTYRFSARA